MSKSAIKTQIQTQFPDNNQNLIVPANVRSIADMTVDESLNIKDGGHLVEQAAGYKTVFTLTDERSFVSKKHLDDNFTKKPSIQEIDGDDNPSNDIRTIVHGKNTATPTIALWYMYDVDKWRMLDITQGITTDEATPNQLSINLLAYEGNTTENKYKIIIT